MLLRLLLLLCLSLSSSICLGATGSSGSSLMDLFNNLFSSTTKEQPDAKVVVKAQLEPYVSKILNNNEALCSQSLNAEDLSQMEYDQYLVQSFLELYKLPESDKAKLIGSNLYMNILLQKIRAPIEAINETTVNSSNMSFLAELSQSDLMVANFMSNVDLIKNMNALITGHQSLELPDYKIDGYIKLAVEEFKDCNKRGTSCVGSDQLWNKWFRDQGFGISSPVITSNMDTKGNATVKENFEIKLAVGPNTSKELIKNMFEIINIYGGANFDYFSYLKGEQLKAEQGLNGGMMNAPGKIVAGLIFKLANQRLVAYYKYQKCRLLKQNAATPDILAGSFYNADGGRDKTAAPEPEKSNPISTCAGNNCSNGTQVTSGTQPLALNNVDCAAGTINLKGHCTLTAGCRKWAQDTCMASSSTPSKTTACPDGFTLNSSGAGSCVANIKSAEVTKAGPTAAGNQPGLHCSTNQDAIYDGDTLVKSCPEGPNGGISCKDAQCSQAGYIFINGSQVKWEGNKSGICYASSACDSGRDCKNNTCRKKTRTSSENGTNYLETWDDSLNDFGQKVSTGCAFGFISEGGSCINQKKCSDVPNGIGYDTYDGNAWKGCYDIKCNDGFERDGTWKRCIPTGGKSCLSSDDYDYTSKWESQFGSLYLTHLEEKTLYTVLPNNGRRYQGALHIKTFKCYNGRIISDPSIPTSKSAADWCSAQGTRCDCESTGWHGFNKVATGYQCEVARQSVNLKHGKSSKVDAAPGYVGKVTLYCFLGRVEASPENCSKDPQASTGAN